MRRIQTIGFRHEAAQGPNAPSLQQGGVFGSEEAPLNQGILQPPSQQQPTETTWTEREYVYGPGYVDEFVIEFDQDQTPLYFLQNANYNVVALTDATGNIVEQRIFEPYGAVAAGETFCTHAVSRVGHQGLFFERLDSSANHPPLAPGAVGFYYNRNRMYSPTLGRFLQRDPNETALPILTCWTENHFQSAGPRILSRFHPSWESLRMSSHGGQYCRAGRVFETCQRADTPPIQGWKTERG